MRLSRRTLLTCSLAWASSSTSPRASAAATGSGKTTVMGMLAAWSILNKVSNPQAPEYSDTVLILCPNVTIRDRRQELDPNLDEASLCRTRDLVPAHRRVLNGIYWRLRTGSPWADIPERYGPPTTCYNRFVRWRKLGVWDRIFEAVSAAYEGDPQMVDSSSVRVHQHGSNVKKGVSKRPRPPLAAEPIGQFPVEPLPVDRIGQADQLMAHVDDLIQPGPEQIIRARRLPLPRSHHSPPRCVQGITDRPSGESPKPPPE